MVSFKALPSESFLSIGEQCQFSKHSYSSVCPAERLHLKCIFTLCSKDCSQSSAVSLCPTHPCNPVESSGVELFHFQTYRETALLSWIC